MKRSAATILLLLLAAAAGSLALVDWRPAPPDRILVAGCDVGTEFIARLQPHVSTELFVEHTGSAEALGTIDMQPGMHVTA